MESIIPIITSPSQSQCFLLLSYQNTWPPKLHHSCITRQNSASLSLAAQPTQGLQHARQVLFHLSHTSTLFFVFWFWDKVSLTLPGLDLPGSTSLVAGITGAYHNALPHGLLHSLSYWHQYFQHYKPVTSGFTFLHVKLFHQLPLEQSMPHFLQ
jgi:hypothetical protein